jgi:hypothetical protein
MDRQHSSEWLSWGRLRRTDAPRQKWSESAMPIEIEELESDGWLSEPIALAAAGMYESGALLLFAGKLSSVVPPFSAARRMKNKAVPLVVIAAGTRTATQQRVGADT